MISQTERDLQIENERLREQLDESEKAREERSDAVRTIHEIRKQEKSRADSAEAREAVLADMLEEALGWIVAPTYVDSRLRNIFSTLPDRAAKWQKVMEAVKNEYKMHQIGCDGAGMPYEKRCDCFFCDAVRELKEVDK